MALETWLNFPGNFCLASFLLAVRLVYGIASSWNWDLSISRVGVNVGWPFGLGYTPILLIIVILEIAGYIEENEDRILLQNRSVREKSERCRPPNHTETVWWG